MSLEEHRPQSQPVPVLAAAPSRLTSNETRYSFLRGGGEVGALMRATDWAKTALGPVETWPQSLKTMVGVVLGNRLPMLLLWGRELLNLYNDAFLPILRDRHPASFAEPARVVWAENWSVIGPLARGVLDGGPAVWQQDQPLFLHRDGQLEEAYFTYSYTGVPGEDGAIDGILCTVQETTEKVQAERQVRTLQELAASAGDAHTDPAAYRAAFEVLSRCELDVPFALLYLSSEHGGAAKLVASSGLDGYTGPALQAQGSLSPAAPERGWPLAEAHVGGELVVEDLGERFGALPAGARGAAPSRALVIPLSSRGFLVLAMSPHRRDDERYRLALRAIAAQIETNLATGRAAHAEAARAEELAELERTKALFLSNISHELRTPLTLILGPIEDALATPAQSMSGHPLEMVHRNARRLLKLVSSLLDFVRIDAQRTRATFEATDLGALTAVVAECFRAPIARAKLTYQIDCPPSIAPLYVDRDLWQKVVSNLLSNAVKFTFEGSIRVATRDLPDHVEVEVSDTGTGIPARELPRLFERFHRVYGARARSFEGSGIGLALARDLVRLHGGSIAVRSRLGEGTTFTVTLPRGSAHLPQNGLIVEDRAPRPSAEPNAFVEEAMSWDAVDARADGPGHAASVAPASGPTAPRRARVLVVDDNADLRDYLVTLLSPLYEVETAADGFAAIEAVATRRPTLVLSDVMMPRLDGFGLIRALRNDRSWKSIPIILLSARADEESTLAAFEAHADDFLAKPFSARELLARVRAHTELAMQRELMERFFAVSLDLMCIATPDGYFKRVSPAFEALGYSQEEMLSRPFFDFLHPDDVAPTAAEVARRSKVANGAAFENRYRTKDGDYRWISWHMVTDEQATIYAIGRDVTEDKLVSSELRRSQQATEAANRDLESFSYSVAHDLRAPLRSIDGFSMALLEDYGELLDEDGKQSLRFLRESAQRMAQLIDDLLGLARVSRHELRVEDADLTALAKGTLARLAEAHPERQVEVIVEEGLTDRGDDRLLGVVLENLLQNAWKFTAKRERARIEFGARMDGAQRVYFVRDNGAGFDMAFAHKLFGVFQRLHSGADFEGTGIGLATVQRVVRRHHGRAWAEGHLGAGATFSFTLHEKDAAP